eukprot:674929-Rhodomonas_salina.3
MHPVPSYSCSVAQVTPSSDAWNSNCLWIPKSDVSPPEVEAKHAAVYTHLNIMSGVPKPCRRENFFGTNVRPSPRKTDIHEYGMSLVYMSMATVPTKAAALPSHSSSRSSECETWTMLAFAGLPWTRRPPLVPRK